MKSPSHLGLLGSSIQLKDETLNNARNEAENIIKEAEIRSRERVKKAKDYLSILEHDYINLKERRKQFIANFKAQLNSILEMLGKDIDKESLEQDEKTFIESEDEEIEQKNEKDP